MKKLLRNLLPEDAARGAFFALTLLMTGSWLGATACLFVSEIDWIGARAGWGWLAVLILLAANCGFASCRFQLLRFRRKYAARTPLFRLTALAAVVAVIELFLYWSAPEPAWGMLLFIVAVYCAWFLPLLSLFLCNSRSSWLEAGAVVFGVSGLLLLTMVVEYLFFSAGITLWAGGWKPGAETVGLAGRLGFSGDGGGWAVTLSVLLLLSGYICRAGFYAAESGRPFHSMFDRRVMALWFAVAAVWLLSAAMSLRADQRVSAAFGRLEKRFGRPVLLGGPAETGITSSPVEKYRAVGLWRLQESVTDLFFDRFGFRNPRFFRFSGLRREELEFFAFPAPELVALERELDRPMVVRGSVFPGLDGGGGVFPDESGWSEEVISIETQRLCALLAAGKPEEAFAIRRRLRKGWREFSNSLAVSGYRTAVRIADAWLDGLELMLESGLLTDFELRRIPEELYEFDSESERWQEQALYAYAIDAIHRNRKLLHGEWYAGGLSELPPLVTFRWLIPEFWRRLRSDQERLISAFLVSAPDRVRERWTERPGVRFYDARLDDVRQAGKSFRYVQIRARAEQVLIRAELYRREHGVFPEFPGDLPDDPSGNPLRYWSGETAIQVARPGDGVVEWETRRGLVARVWSVGPDWIDDGGGVSGPDGRGRIDDVRAVLRIGSSAGNTAD